MKNHETWPVGFNPFPKVNATIFNSVGRGKGYGRGSSQGYTCSWGWNYNRGGYSNLSNYEKIFNHRVWENNVGKEEKSKSGHR